MMVLNPKLVDICGKGSEDMFNELISAIGEDAAIRTNIDTMYGFIQMNGVNMPRCLTAATDIADKVADDIWDFVVKHRGSSNAEIEVHNEKFSKGDIPLMVVEADNNSFNAVSLMAGE